MDFEAEDFVPLFTRDTPTWLGWGWETRCVLPLLLRKVDLRGRLEWPHRWSAARAVSEMIRVPESVCEPAIVELVDYETIQIGERWLLVVNHERARMAVLATHQGPGHASALTQAERSKLYRVRRKERLRASEAESASRNVTASRDASRNVTDRDGPPSPPSPPSLPSVSSLEPSFLSPPTLSLPPLTPGACAPGEQEPPHSVETAAEAEARAPSLFAEIDTKPKSRKSKPRKQRTAYPEGLEEHLLSELQAACRSVGRLGPRKVTEPMRDDLRKLYAACEPTIEDCSHVVAVRCEMTKRGEGYGHLTWDSICVPSNFRRWLAEPLGQRRAAPGGRVEPGPRPTETKVIDLRAMARPKES